MKTKQFLTILIAMFMSVLITQWALAADEETAEIGPAGASSDSEAALAELLADIEADRSAVVDDLVSRFATDDASAEQLAATLAAASAADLAEIDLNAGSLDEVNVILGGSEDIERLGQTTEDYAYTAVTPCRIVNTQFGGGGLFVPGVARSYFVYGGGGTIGAQGGSGAGCPSPNGEPRAVHINVTAVPQLGNGNGNFKAYPDGFPAPGSSLVNYKSPGGQNIANAATIKTRFQLGGARELRVLNSFGNAHLIIDVLGYYHETENLAGADFVGGNQNLVLGPGDAIVRSITISAPDPGRVIVNASGYFNLGSAAVDTGRCSITTGVAVDFAFLIIAGERTVGGAMTFVPFAGTRGFNVGAGNTTFRLVCDEFAGNVNVADTNLTGIWVPRNY